MIGLKAFKDNFFDRAAVMDRVPPAARKALSKFGAFVRQRARSSIKVREGTSLPGSPPFGHKSGTRLKASKKTGTTKRQPVSLLREFILFAFEPERHSVIAGPAKLSGKIGNAPEALEKGGVSEMLAASRDGRRERKRIDVEPRPFMQPAFEAELPKAAPLFKDTIR